MAQAIPCLPQWLHHAMAQPQAVSVRLGNDRQMFVFPQQARFNSTFDVYHPDQLGDPDMWQPPQLEMLPIPQDSAHLLASTTGTEQLERLQWALLWEQARRHFDKQEFIHRYGMVRLLSWPDIANLPQEIQSPIARICALLTHRPSAGTLLPALLQLPRHEVYALLSILLFQQHISIKMPLEGMTVEEKARADASANDKSLTQTMGGSMNQAARALIGKLWTRLTSI